jgi:hypothetical protein
MTRAPTPEPSEFQIGTDYGYSKIIPRAQFTKCGCDLTILGVPLGAHTFTVEARWAPGVKSADSKPVTIAP